MKNFIKISLLASLLASTASAEMVNPKIHVIYGKHTGAPFMFTNYSVVVPTMNINGGTQWATNHLDVGDIVVVEDFDMMARTWVWNGQHRVYQDTPEQIAYREEAAALEIKAQKTAFFSDPFNVQALSLVTVLYSHLTWYIVAGCFAFAFLFKKSSSQFEDALAKGLLLSLLSIGAMILLLMPHNFTQAHIGLWLLAGIALIITTVIIKTIKNRFSQDEAE